MIQNIRTFGSNFNKNPFFIKTMITLLLRVLGVFVLFAFTMFITNHYPAKIVGQYDFVRSFLLIIGSLSLLGTDQSILFFTGKLQSKNSYKDLYAVYLKMVIIVVIATVILGFLFLLIGEQIIVSFFQDRSVYSLIYKCMAVLFFNALTLLNTELFRCLDCINIAEFFRNIFKYVPVIFGSILLLSIDKIKYLVDFYLFGFVLLAIITTYLAFYLFKKKDVKNMVTNITYREIIKQSYPIAFSSMAIFLLLGIDIILLKKYQNNEIIAFYGTAVKLVTILSVIVITVNVTISTKISQLYFSRELKELKELLKSNNRLIAIMTIPLSFFLVYFSIEILGFFGEQYTSASSSLQILIFGQSIACLFGSAPTYLNMTGRQSVFQLILFVAVAINLVSNILLIPEYGMEGAAVSFVLSLVFWNFITWLYIFKKDKVNIFIY